MRKLKVLDLFAGAGGFTVAGELAGGYETVAFCEIDKYAQKVLAKHWPNVPIFDDVTKLHAQDIDETIDVITGGFPCQDLSAAGRGAGLGDGTRSGLFREMLRLACEVMEKQGRLPYIIFENVARLLSGPSDSPGEWFGEFLWSLAEVGYDAEWFCITAASIGAPHERERVCVVAYAAEMQCDGSKFDIEYCGKKVSKLRDGIGAGLIKPGGISKRVAEIHAQIDAYASEVGRSEILLQTVTGCSEETYKFWKSINDGPLSGKCTWADWERQSGVCGVSYGIPSQSHRLGIMGNAIVPQVFAIPMRALYEAHFDA